MEFTEVEDLSEVWLWYNPYFPKCDWEHIKVVDLLAPEHTCIACGKEEIRYVHYIEHELWGEIKVGCVCAGKLIGNESLAKRLEKNERNKTKRRDNFINKAKWKLSQKGNYYLKKKLCYGEDWCRKYVFILFKNYNGKWQYTIKCEGSEYYIVKSENTYNSLEEIKKYLFNEYIDNDLGIYYLLANYE